MEVIVVYVWQWWPLLYDCICAYGAWLWSIINEDELELLI